MKSDLSIKTEINLYYDLLVPEGLEQPAPLIIAVHGYGAHKRYMMREARAVAPDGFVIASLQAPHQHFRQTETGYRVGFGWLTDYRSDESVEVHHRFIDQVIERLVDEGIADDRAIYFFGFSQACALNFRYVFTNPNVAKGVIGICGGVPGDLETSERFRPTDAGVFYLYNTEDEFYPLEKYESYASRLKAFASNLQTAVYDSKHEITDPMREDVRHWLKEKAEGD